MKSLKTQLRFVGFWSLTLCLLTSAYAQYNTATGTGALHSDTSGYVNTADGVNALYSNTTGYWNTAAGVDALYTNSAGIYNTAMGVNALYFNTGNFNTAMGVNALDKNTTGYDNAAVGVGALNSNTSGYQNTAMGVNVLYSNTDGFLNAAYGFGALYYNTHGYDNTAIGGYSLFQNFGSYNTSLGVGALRYNTIGSENVGIGITALLQNIGGSDNTAIGSYAGPDSASPNLSYATAIGANAVVSESNALVLGGPRGSGADVYVGIGTATPSNILTLAQGGGAAIGDGWSTYSSRRWKSNIQTLHGALDKVERLRGVSYDLKANGKHEVGVIAEEVGAVVPEVVTWEEDGKNAQSVDYSRLTALLIEATKEQQALIRDQKAEIAAQQAQITLLTRQVKTVQAVLKASGRTGSAMRTVKAEALTMHQ
ncbi:MAG TPA: tail fiber domain-containing protein [Terriglobales bacterium]|nr:tail fiber domain-containing protein [Terriglobales bacterium]